MKRLLCFHFLLFLVFSTYAQDLKFKADGKFKIVQFTDIHYIFKDTRSDVALERIQEVLDTEKPDLVVFTGDLIYGTPAEQGIRTVLEQVSTHKIPFAVTFGNHDDEQGLSREELLKIVQTIPYNLTYTTKSISGVSNFILPIKSSDGKRDAEILYFFDSHSYSQIKGIEGYDYIHIDQIQWYRENSRKYTENHKGIPLPSLAFFHIPLPEYHLAATDENAALFGSRKEKVCSPFLNSGLFTAIKEMGDIEAIFVGHDHDNDYAVMWQGVLLAYGRYTGGNTVYNNLPNGARVIELTEGVQGFRTWIRTANNQIEQYVKFPESFLKPNK